MSDLSWKEILKLVSGGQDLDSTQAHWAMSQMMSGTATDAQIGGLAIGLRTKGETASEISGMVSAMLENAILVSLDRNAVDVVGTGGDGAHTVNISTMAALTVAGAGIPVLKHGNRAVSSKCGTADVLEACGVAIDMPPTLVSSCVASAGIGFCFAPAHHPAMRYAGPARSQLGVPTVFNVLGPLANPGQPQAALLGCADKRLAPVLAQVQRDRGKQSIIVRSDSGLDELSTDTTSQIWDVTSGELRHEILDPRALRLRPSTLEDLRGGDANYNASVLMDVIQGRKDGKFEIIRDVVALNAAATMVAYDASTGEERFGPVTESATMRIARALSVAYHSLDSGSAGMVLELWVLVSQRFALSQ